MSLLGDKKFFKFWFPVILYSGIIFWASSLPPAEIPLTFDFSDKIFHALEYSILGYLLARAIREQKVGFRRREVIFYAFIFLFLYSLSDEFHQLFVPGRTATIGDLIADGIGGWLGAWIYPFKKIKATLSR
jgi:VanZ family protein